MWTTVLASSDKALVLLQVGGDQHRLGVVELLKVEHERRAALLQMLHEVARLGERQMSFYSFRLNSFAVLYLEYLSS